MIFNKDGASAATVIRALRIARIFKLIRDLDSINLIFEAFIRTIPGLLNVGGLLILMIFIYSVLTTYYFSEVMYSGPMTNNLNFDSTWNSAMALFIMQTGNNFFELSNAAAMELALEFQCINNPSYSFYRDNGF